MAALTIDRTAGITTGLDELPPALGMLRSRMRALGEELDSERWAGPSRCHRWSAHEVFRHVRDACRLHVTGLQGDPFWPFDKPFDSRATPDEWLSLSAGQSREQTLEELRRWSADEPAMLRERLDSGDQDVVGGPYGPIPWTVLSMHVLWDGWLHDRDIARVAGGGSPSTLAEDPVVATYALFIASMPAVLHGRDVDATVALSGDAGHYVASVRPGHVELESVDAPVAADLHGPLHEVVDSLAGRGPLLAELLEGDAAKREPLTWLRAILAPAPTS